MSAPALFTSDGLGDIDAILDDLRTRNDETPEWEFCDGMLAALVCCRRAIAPDEYLALLLGVPPHGAQDTLPVTPHDSPNYAGAGEGAFADDAQRARFMEIWDLRWRQVASALAAGSQSLDEAGAYQPEVIDLRSVLATLPQAERAAMGDLFIPSFGQVWALGFMFAVECWPEEWAAPPDQDAAQLLDAAMHAIVALTEDDTDVLAPSPLRDDTPPRLSQARLARFVDAVWAVYDLYALGRSLGPRGATLRAQPQR